MRNENNVKLFRITAFVLTVLILLLCIGYTDTGKEAAAEDKNISVNGYSDGVDYLTLMMEAVNEGGVHALKMGELYEEQRNMKIDKLKLPYEKTYYFQKYKTAKEIKQAMEDKQRGYTDSELKLLAQVINAEAGCAWYPDWVQQAVGSVVLNRVRSAKYPNTIHDVVYQAGQYGCVRNGSIYKNPTQKCIKNAKYILEHGGILPIGVIGQSGAVQGKIYTSYYDSVLGTTTYFCY